MTLLSDKHPSDLHDPIKVLENEIADFENELHKTEVELNTFEYEIRSKLYHQILRIRELTHLYKTQKLAKKIKRLEQKKKGKNYKEPQSLQKLKQDSEEENLNKDELQELKRLYKEAIVHVHPDKFVNENSTTTERANELTVKLNAIYKSGDLDELSLFHEHILSGNAMRHVPCKSETIVDQDAMITFLKKKKENLIQALEGIKRSPTYSVLTTYESPLLFIDELRIQFEQRIMQLEKRTRKG